MPYPLGPTVTIEVYLNAFMELQAISPRFWMQHFAYLRSPILQTKTVIKEKLRITISLKKVFVN